MPIVSNLSDGALIASNNAAKAQRDFSKSIAKLSTGKRTMYGSDPAGQSVADSRVYRAGQPAGRDCRN